MRLISRLPVLILLLTAAPALPQDFVPDALQGWQGWVLKDKEYRACPFYYDRAAAGPQDFVCAWPGTLQLEVTSAGGRFSQQWTVHGAGQWIALPGNADHWPDRVTVGDRAVRVVARNNVPSVRLEAGSHVVAGRFAWDERPAVLAVPPESGLVELDVDGRRVQRPEMNGAGVYLGERREETRAVDSVRTVVHRLVVDELPVRLVTQLQIDVSGGVREAMFGPVLPAGFVPMSLQSRLPARLEADGQLRLQVRPGRWTVFLTARGPGVLDEIGAADVGTNMPETEIWSYQANDRLRVTAAEGLPPVDPSQVDVPGMWQQFPAFRMDPGAAFRVVERSRGIVSASNELSLERTMWLDFDGGGFVVDDAVTGTMRTAWRLDMQPPYALLSAAENGESLLITASPEDGASGVEVRQTAVQLEALSRSATRDAMPVTGWDARFASVRATLHMPPGHKLLTAPGVDQASGSWMAKWQLLDFFLLLIITIAAWRLFGPVPGVIALLAIVLSYQEMSAPTWLWLNLLVAIALFRVTPEGRLRLPVRIYQFLSAAALLLALIPFVADQLRLAIYPQLEPQYNEYQVYEYDYAPASLPVESGVPGRAREEARAVMQSLAPVESMEDIAVTAQKRAATTFARYAPNAIVQAGPGVPGWKWNTYTLRWSGPVDADQSMRLVILPRWLVSALRTIEVGLLLLFAGVLAAEIAGRAWRLPGGMTLGRAPVAAAVVVGALFAGAGHDAGAQMPDAELLRQLEQRLTEPPECVPRCAEIVAATVDIGETVLSMQLTVHAFEDVAIPLPGSMQGWRPELVKLDGGSTARVLRGAGSALWLYVMPGQHTITLRGSMPDVDSVEVPFPTPPRVVTAQAQGWLVSGIKDRRLLSGSLQLTRLQTDADGADAPRWEASRFPAFARVQRSVELDLDWRVTTTVQRLAPEQGALTIELPLVDGETIVSGDFTVRDGRVLVTMAPQQNYVQWTSNLPAQSTMTLEAAGGGAWQEVWRFAIGNVWHVKFEGVPENEPADVAGDVRVAEFNPRDGEALTVMASRPEAVAGSTLAFDSVRLEVVYGGRSSDLSLNLRYRSTRGAQHPVRLPAGAEVTGISIDGREQTLRAENGTIMLPILPGEHGVLINWRADGGMGLRTVTPDIDLGAPASNIDIAMTTPRDRWLLATQGPKLGPAVLYWSELAVLVLFAVILGRIGLAPLRMHHWLLLGLGFSTFNWPVLGVVAAWLLACGARERWATDVDAVRFNVLQVMIGGLTVIALLAIVTSLPMGLLGTPDMHVSGHASHGNVLGWFADRSESVLPVAAAFTAPLWIYKALILAWALWLSFALLRWLPWVWHCFSSQGYWRSKKAGEANQ